MKDNAGEAEGDRGDNWWGMTRREETRYLITLKGLTIFGFKIERLKRDRFLFIITDPNPGGVHLTDVVERTSIKPHTSGRQGKHLPTWDVRKEAQELDGYIKKHIFRYHPNRKAYLPLDSVQDIVDEFKESVEILTVIPLELILGEFDLEDREYFSKIRIRDLLKTPPHYGYVLRKGGINFVFPIDRNQVVFIPVSYVGSLIVRILDSIGMTEYLNQISKLRGEEIKKRINDVMDLEELIHGADEGD